MLKVSGTSFKWKFEIGDEFALAFDFFDPHSEVTLDGLSPDQLDICAKFKSVKRKHEYASGRRSCRKALSALDPKLKNSEVLNDRAGVPFVNSEYNVTLSHSHGISVALVSSNLIFGIDLELCDPKRVDALRVMSPKVADLEDLTVLWTLKEALSKALHTGLNKEFSMYEVANFRHDGVCFRCEFENFRNYEGFAFFNGKFSFAVVCKCGLHFPSQNMKQFVLRQLEFANHLC